MQVMKEQLGVLLELVEDHRFKSQKNVVSFAWNVTGSFRQSLSRVKFRSNLVSELDMYKFVSPIPNVSPGGRRLTEESSDLCNWLPLQMKS